MRLWHIPRVGGRPEALDRPGELDGAARYTSPELLPGGQAVIFTKTVGGRSAVAALSLRTRRTTVLVDNAIDATFVQATGHLVYQVDSTLIAVPFDPSQLTRVGEPHTLETDVGAWGVSAGALAYGPPARSRLSWKDRHGGVVPQPITISSHIDYLALSPDGRRVVLMVDKNNRRTHQLYRADLDNGANVTRLTSGDDDWFGVFTPGSSRVLYTSGVHEGGSIRYNTFSTAADGSGAPVRLTTGPSWQKASAVGRADARESSSTT